MNLTPEQVHTLNFHMDLLRETPTEEQWEHTRQTIVAWNLHPIDQADAIHAAVEARDDALREIHLGQRICVKTDPGTRVVIRPGVRRAGEHGVYQGRDRDGRARILLDGDGIPRLYPFSTVAPETMPGQAEPGLPGVIPAETGQGTPPPPTP